MQSSHAFSVSDSHRHAWRADRRGDVTLAQMTPFPGVMYEITARTLCVEQAVLLRLFLLGVRGTAVLGAVSCASCVGLTQLAQLSQWAVPAVSGPVKLR